MTSPGPHNANLLGVDPHKIDIKFRATFFSKKPRKYLWILENGYEMNTPQAFFCIPPNPICPGTDIITKSYFDRGVYDQQNCYWCIGFYNGDGRLYANEVKYVCCCQECPVCYNEFLSCYFSSCCGERVRAIPAEKYCWCCPTTATCFTNCLGCYGPKTGEPLLLLPFSGCCLATGEADKVVEAANEARTAWKQRQPAMVKYSA